MMPLIYDKEERLIDKYSIPVIIRSYPNREKIHGVWQKGEPVETEIELAVVPFAKKDIYSAGGRITTDDRLVCSMVPLEDGNELIYQGRTYVLEFLGDYREYGQHCEYIGKYVKGMIKNVGSN